MATARMLMIRVAVLLLTIAVIWAGKVILLNDRSDHGDCGACANSPIVIAVTMVTALIIVIMLIMASGL